MFDELRDHALTQDDDGRRETIEALAGHEPARDVYQWAISQVQDPSLPVRRFAADVLEELSYARPKFSLEAADALRPRLADERDPATLLSVIRAYGEFGHDAGELRQHMAHPDAEIRAEVAARLETLEPLLVLAYDPDGEVRRNALYSMFRTTEPGATAVRQAYADHRDDDYEQARIEALAGLARDGDEEALTVLHAIAAVQQGFTARSRIEEIDFRRSLHFGH